MMTPAIWMLLAAALLPYLCAAAAKFGGPGYDNASPRASLSRLTGWRARADGAQRNGFEAFPAFAVGVLVARLAHAPQHRVNMLAVAFIIVRLAYIAAYIADAARVRSLMFFIGIVLIVLLFVAGAGA